MNNDNNDNNQVPGGLPGEILAWALMLALLWVLALGLYALTQWVFRSV